MKKELLKAWLVVGLMLMFSGVGYVFAQPQAMSPAQQAIKQKMIRLPVSPGVDLRPSLWVNCCTCSGNCEGNCDDLLSRMGYMLVDWITIDVYNAGKITSDRAEGKVEFYDVFSGSVKTYSFVVDPVGPRKFATVRPNKINGPFLIKKSDGVRVSVTYNPKQVTIIGGKRIPSPKVTRTYTQKECSRVY